MTYIRTGEHGHPRGTGAPRREAAVVRMLGTAIAVYVVIIAVLLALVEVVAGRFSFPVADMHSPDGETRLVWSTGFRLPFGLNGRCPAKLAAVDGRGDTLDEETVSACRVDGVHWTPYKVYVTYVDDSGKAKRAALDLAP